MFMHAPVGVPSVFNGHSFFIQSYKLSGLAVVETHYAPRATFIVYPGLQSKQCRSFLAVEMKHSFVYVTNVPL